MSSNTNTTIQTILNQISANYSIDDIWNIVEQHWDFEVGDNTTLILYSGGIGEVTETGRREYYAVIQPDRLKSPPHQWPHKLEHHRPRHA